eukprot:10649135-Alexandrium_andersonii.AAC.1
MSASLVGSEMCIRDRPSTSARRRSTCSASSPRWASPRTSAASGRCGTRCLLYTSDAADDM